MGHLRHSTSAISSASILPKSAWDPGHRMNEDRSARPEALPERKPAGEPKLKLSLSSLGMKPTTSTKSQSLGRCRAQWDVQGLKVLGLNPSGSGILGSWLFGTGWLGFSRPRGAVFAAGSGNLEQSSLVLGFRVPSLWFGFRVLGSKFRV